MFMRMTVLSGCGALLAALASSGCASFFEDAGVPSARPLPAAAAVYGVPLGDRERILVVRIPATSRGPVVVSVACADAQVTPLGFKPSPYEDEPERVAYKPSPYEDDVPVPLPLRPSPYKDPRAP
jgi:hypothetical protein